MQWKYFPIYFLSISWTNLASLYLYFPNSIEASSLVSLSHSGPNQAPFHTSVLTLVIFPKPKSDGHSPAQTFPSFSMHLEYNLSTQSYIVVLFSRLTWIGSVITLLPNSLVTCILSSVWFPEPQMLFSSQSLSTSVTPLCLQHPPALLV